MYVKDKQYDAKELIQSELNYCSGYFDFGFKSPIIMELGLSGMLLNMRITRANPSPLTITFPHKFRTIIDPKHDLDLEGTLRAYIISYRQYPKLVF